MRYVIPLILGLCAGQALAHDLWIDRDHTRYVLRQGHAHSAHAGATVVPYDPAIVKNAYCVKPGGGIRSLALGKKHPVAFSGQCDAVLVSVSSGYWTKTPWETKNAPKTGMSSVLKSWRSEESVKRLDRWTSGSAKPLGKGLEITPLSDPFGLAVQDKVTVRVTLNGQPVAGVPVAYQGETRGTSNTDGTISLRIRKRGVQLISTSQETPLNDGKADTLIRSSALQFTVSR